MEIYKTKLFKKIKRHFLFQNSLTRKLYIWYVKKILVKLKKDEIGIVLDHNIGETYLFCSLINFFKKQNNLKKIVLISGKKYHADIFDMFSDRIYRYYVSPFIYSRSFRSFREIKEDSFYFVYDHTTWNYASLVENKMTNLQLLKISANINPNAMIEYNQDKEIYKTQAREFFNKLGLMENKTVLVSPEAKSCNSLDKTFCQNICKRLKDKGYDVFLNLMSSNNISSHAKSAFLPLSLATSFSDLCGHVVVIRSGFCDIISGSKARFHIIYPDQSFQNVFPVKERMTSNYVKEYLLEGIAEKDIIESIIKNI